MFKFGSIEYLNLLPFQVYIKKRISNTQFKQMLHYRKSVPSGINSLFNKGAIDGAFISSIHSKNKRCLDLGIVANGRVYSVLLLPGVSKIDTESASSNALARVLELNGKVMIGDKALKYYLSGREAIDLSLEWKKKTDLPFVFARLCCKSRCKELNKIIKQFNPNTQKIPTYILKRESKKRGITPSDTLWYLSHIDYNLKWREKKALNRFLKETKQLGIRY